MTAPGSLCSRIRIKPMENFSSISDAAFLLSCQTHMTAPHVILVTLWMISAKSYTLLLNWNRLLLAMRILTSTNRHKFLLYVLMNLFCLREEPVKYLRFCDFSLMKVCRHCSLCTIFLECNCSQLVHTTFRKFKAYDKLSHFLKIHIDLFLGRNNLIKKICSHSLKTYFK